MSRFKRMHPLLQLVFFAASLLLPVLLRHPFFTLIVTAVTGAFHFLFTHYGQSVLFHAFHTDFTLEALFYGIHQGWLLSAVFLWFTLLGRLLDGDRLRYLFRFAPKLALTFSVVLGFLPRFLKKLEDIRTARLALNGGAVPEGLRGKLRAALDDLSVLISYSLEAGMVTADSMSARDIRLEAVSPKRFTLTKPAVALLLLMLTAVTYILLVKINGDIIFIFEPRIALAQLSLPALGVFTALEFSAGILELWENYRWKKSNATA